MQLFSGDTPLFLAPMAGVTDYAFRTVCAQHGADVTVTEMVSSRALVYQDRKSRGLLRHTVLLERLLAQQKNSLLKQVGLLRPHHEDLPRRSLDHCAPSLSRTLSGIWRDSTRPEQVTNGCR